jgi:hypothetical protein
VALLSFSDSSLPHHLESVADDVLAENKCLAKNS